MWSVWQLLLEGTAGHYISLHRLFTVPEPVARLLCQQESISSIRSLLQTISFTWYLLVRARNVSLTFVVGPSSFSATQLCRLNERSLQFTSTRLPNFSSNCFTSGSIPEKSSFYKQHIERFIIASAKLWGGKKWTSFLGYLSVWVQSEQFQSGFIPHPVICISCALK